MKIDSMKFWQFVIAICFACSLQAQNKDIDSLKNLMSTTTDPSKRVQVLEGLSYAYSSSYPDSSLQYAEEGLRLALLNKDKKGEGLCVNAIGNVYFHVGDYSRALEMFLKYLKIREEQGASSGVSVAYFNIANVYTEQADYPHALHYIFKAKQLDENLNDTTGILFDFYSLGSIYLRMQKSDSALYYMQLSHQLAERTNDENMMGAILNTFGEIYLLLNNTALAAKYYKLSIPYTEDIKDLEVLSSNYYGLAKVFRQSNALDSAISYARKARSISKVALYHKFILETSSFLTDIFRNQKKYDSAFFYQELSIATRDSLFNMEQLKKVQNLKFQEQQRQQAIDTARLEYEHKISLYIVIFASAIFLAITLLLWRNNKQKRKANTLLQNQKEKLETTLAELKSTQALLIQSEKMASIGVLTAGIAHEIRNPLNFVNNFSALSKELFTELRMEMDKGNMEEAQSIARDIEKNLDKINHHGQRTDGIVKSMLQHSRKSSGERELIDINDLCDEYLRLSYHGIRAKDKSFHATLQTDFGSAIGSTNVVPQDIGRVLLNLYGNAFYAVSAKAVATTDGNYEPTVTVSTKRIGDKIEIRVKDNGNGIPEKNRDKIFQPFFTTKPTGQGTGLGLSISYDIVKAHGGEIKLETKDGEGPPAGQAGSEFIIYLPTV